MKTLLILLVSLILVACSGGTPETPATQTSAPPPAMLSASSSSQQALQRFQRGVNLLDQLRPDEAARELTEALRLDPDFAVARAFYGQTLRGPEGEKELRQAASQTVGLREPERLLVEALLADRLGDLARSHALWTRLTEVAPSDWRAHYGLGGQLLAAGKHYDAVLAYQQALKLNSKAAPALNMLGYASLRRGALDEAIAAFTQYVAAYPGEPGPHDALGEALMAAGRFTDAEASFRRAVELSPGFANAWVGIAYSRFFAGDPAAARDALAKARAVSSRPAEKVMIEELFGWGALAEENVDEALKAFAAAEAVSGAGPVDTALVPVHRALVLIGAGRHAEALPQLMASVQRASQPEFSPAFARDVRGQALAVRALADARRGDMPGLRKTLEALEQEAMARPEELQLQSWAHFGRGMQSLLARNPGDARAHFERCSVEQTLCDWQEAVAAEQAGDRPGAAALRDRILRLYLRDPLYLYVRSRLTGPATTPSTP